MKRLRIKVQRMPCTMRRAVNWLDYRQLPRLSVVQSPLNWHSPVHRSHSAKSIESSSFYWNWQRELCASAFAFALLLRLLMLVKWWRCAACLALVLQQIDTTQKERHKLRLIQQCQQILCGPGLDKSEDRRGRIWRDGLWMSNELVVAVMMRTVLLLMPLFLLQLHSSKLGYCSCYWES